MIRTLLIDDEKYAIKNLSALIKLYCPKLEVVGTAENAMNGVKMINHLKPDLIFLDIEMPVHSGFDLLECFPERTFKTVFVTAYDQYALKAFNLQALDYLLKPINPDDLKTVAKRVLKMEQSTQQKQVDNLLDYNKTGKNQKIAIPTNTGIRFIPVDSIIYLEASSNYTLLHLKESKPLLIAKTIKTFETILEEPVFTRIHRGFIVNLQEVTEYSRTGGGTLEMSNGTLLGVSKSRQKHVQQLLEQLITFL